MARDADQVEVRVYCHLHCRPGDRGHDEAPRHSDLGETQTSLEYSNCDVEGMTFSGRSLQLHYHPDTYDGRPTALALVHSQSELSSQIETDARS